MSLTTRAVATAAGTNVHGIDRGGISQFVQSVYPNYEQAVFTKMFTQIAAATTSAEFNCNGYHDVAAKVEFSTSVVVAIFQIWLRDVNSLWIPFTTITPSNNNVSPTGITSSETAYSHGILFTFPTLGMTGCKVRLTSISSGNLGLWLANI